jgi:hypothetical protein
MHALLLLLSLSHAWQFQVNLPEIGLHSVPVIANVEFFPLPGNYSHTNFTILLSIEDETLFVLTTNDFLPFYGYSFRYLFDKKYGLNSANFTATITSPFESTNITAQSTASIRVVPGFLSLLAPVTAFALSWLLRRAFAALLVAVWFGCTVIEGYNPLAGMLRSVSFYIDGKRNVAHARVY